MIDQRVAIVTGGARGIGAAGDADRGGPGAVDRGRLRRQPAQPGFPHRIRDSTLAWTRWQACRNCASPAGILVATTWKR